MRHPICQLLPSNVNNVCVKKEKNPRIMIFMPIADGCEGNYIGFLLPL